MILLASADRDVLRRWRCTFGEGPDVDETTELTAVASLLGYLKPVLLVLDLGLLGSARLDALGALRRQSPGTRLLLAGPSLDDETELELFRAGARAYLGIDARPDVLGRIRDAVLAGETCLSRRLLPRLLESLPPPAVRPATIPDAARDPEGGIAAPSLERLTGREREIAALVGEGLSNKLVARRLGITERTVKCHLTEIFRKTGAEQRLALALLVNGARA